jgi:chromate transporter
MLDREAEGTLEPARAGRSRRGALVELAWLFLKLGTTAFGGPAAHIAMMEDEVVRRRRWLTGEAFLDLLGATNLIPGPNSTELAIHIGHRGRVGPGSSWRARASSFPRRSS